jgi:hypothetical protein
MFVKIVSGAGYGILGCDTSSVAQTVILWPSCYLCEYNPKTHQEEEQCFNGCCVCILNLSFVRWTSLAVCTV